MKSNKENMSVLNMTPLRISVLRFLAGKPNGYNAKAMVAAICPRSTQTGHWTEQGLARMTGKVVKPMADAKLIRKVEWTSRMCDMTVEITDAGRELVAEHELVNPQHDSEAEICSAA